MNTILVVDDHAIVRKGLIQVLEDANPSYTFIEAGNGGETMQQLRQESPAAVLLDIAMPGRRGTEVLGQIKQEFPKVPVLILSSYPEDQYAVRLIRAGAAGYLNKQSSPEELIDAVEKVILGKKYISATVAALLADSLSSPKDGDDSTPLHERLSDREYHVFIQIAHGFSLTDIGKEINLSVKTIATYRSRLLEKMGMSSNAELTLYAVRNNLIE